MDGDAIDAQRHDLLVRLVNSLGLERGDDSTTIEHENFETALEYAASRIATHSFGEPAERAIERRFDQLADKFSVHLHEDAARRLRSLCAVWLSAACCSRAGKRGVVVERVACMWSVSHSVLLLLSLLSQDPCAELEAQATRDVDEAGLSEQGDKDSPQSTGSSSWSIIQDGDANVEAAERATGGGGGDARAGTDASASGSSSWGVISESGAVEDAGDTSHLSVAWRREWEEALTEGHVSPGAHDFDELERARDSGDDRGGSSDGGGDDGDLRSVAMEASGLDIPEPGHASAANIVTRTPSPLAVRPGTAFEPAPAASGSAVSADSTSLSLSLSLSDETKNIEQQLSQRYELNPRNLHRNETDQSMTSAVPDTSTMQPAVPITAVRAHPSRNSARGQEDNESNGHTSSLPSLPSMAPAAPELDVAIGAWLAPHAHPPTYASVPPQDALAGATDATSSGTTGGLGTDGAVRLAPDAMPSALPAEMLVRARALRLVRHDKSNSTPGLQACLQTCAAASAAACAPTVLESEVVHDVVRLLQGLPTEHGIKLEWQNGGTSSAAAILRVGAGIAHLSDAALHAALSTFAQAVYDATELRSAIARIDSAAAMAASSGSKAGLGATAEAFGSALAEFVGGFENLLACFERKYFAMENQGAMAAGTTSSNSYDSGSVTPTLLQLASDLRRHLSRLHALRQLLDATNLFVGYEDLSVESNRGQEQQKTEADENHTISHRTSLEARSRRRDNALRSRRILDACYAALQAELLLDANSTEECHEDAGAESPGVQADCNSGPLGSLLALTLLRDSLQPLLLQMGSWMADGTLGTVDQVGSVVQATSPTGSISNDEFFVIPSSQRQRAHGRASGSAKHDVGVGVRLAAGFLIHADAVPAFLAPLAEAVLRCGASVHLLGELAAPGAGQESIGRALGRNVFAGFSAVTQPSHLRQGRQRNADDSSGLPTYLRHRFDEALLAMITADESRAIPRLRHSQLSRLLHTAYSCGVATPPPPKMFYSSSYCRGGQQNDSDSDDELNETGIDTVTLDRNVRKLEATLARTSAELLIWQTMLRPLVERHATVSRALVIALLHSNTQDQDSAADTSAKLECTLPTPGALDVTGSNTGLVPRLLEMRNVFFMARAELLDGYYTWLFGRLESGDAGWPNAQRLNARIRASLVACDTESTDRLERRLRVVVGGSAARQSPSSLAALAVDSVTLTLDVPWPLCLVIDEGAVRKYVCPCSFAPYLDRLIVSQPPLLSFNDSSLSTRYQRVHALLVQLLRAKVGLEQYHHRVRQSMKRRHVRELARLRRRRMASGMTPPTSSEGKQGFAGASRAPPPVPPLPAQEVASVLGGVEHQLMLYLCEMQHFARRIHAHVASQATQAVWPALHARLCAIASHAQLRPDADAFGSTSGAIVSVEALHGLHCDYLDRVLEQTFLLPKQQALLNHIHKALALALEFREALGLWMRARKRSERALWRREREQGLCNRATMGGLEWSSSDNDSDEENVTADGSVGVVDDTPNHLHLLELHKSFRQRLRWLVMVVSKGVKVAGEQSRLAPWLSELLLGLNFNEFVVRF